MKSLAYPLRFYRVVAPVPPLVGWTFLVLVLIGTLVIVHDPTRAASALIPVLLLQLFAASSGFEVPARRGHYDLLLTSGSGRASMALVHWGTSVAPGIIAWLALVVIEQLASGGNVSRLLASGTLAALCLVSTLPWAITVHGCRGSRAASDGFWPWRFR